MSAYTTLKFSKGEAVEEIIHRLVLRDISSEKLEHILDILLEAELHNANVY